MDFCFWQYGGLDPLKGLPKILKIFVLVVMPLIIFFYANFFSFLISFLIGETNHLSYWLSCILHLADCFLVYHLTLECSFMLYIFGKQSFMWMLNEILVKFFFFFDRSTSVVGLCFYYATSWSSWLTVSFSDARMISVFRWYQPDCSIIWSSPSLAAFDEHRSIILLVIYIYWLDF